MILFFYLKISLKAIKRHKKGGEDLKEFTARLLEADGVKAPEKIEAAIIKVLAENNLTVAASKEILSSVEERITREARVTLRE